ncbi:cytochrome P450 6a2-like [Diabrotica virgifera virgifera]|uniref:Cytochrome P450 n=1 Tax=Diabrotica virgifera virgifera TaxID=50390 RepID=A0ABM5KG80_DIAVI|nr:cytochrome P450 6a2-like [Diabrotica virgifera virgifera]
MLLVLCVVACSLFVYWINRRYSHWSKRGIPGPSPLPLVGNFWKNITGKKSTGEIITEVYNDYKDYPFVGVYRNITPILVPRDPDLIKNILVKDFKNFHDNDVDVDPEVDPIFGRNPFTMKGAAWKHKRAQLTTCFTSGKIKGMYYFIDNTGKRMVKYIEEQLKQAEPLEAREVCVRFTLDNVAACAFGVEGKSFDEPCSELRELADNLFSPEGFVNKLMWMTLSIVPELFKYLKIKLVSKEVETKLFDIVKGSLKYRKEKNIVRNDFLDIIKNQVNEDGSTAEVIDILANAVSFFTDGYETSSRVMSFLLYDFALNPDVQTKLREQLTDIYKKNNDQFTYESVNELQYLDACLSESLRVNSVVYMLSKVCTEDYTYTPTNSDYKPLTVNMKVGDVVMVPLLAVQMDPKYFEDPDKYKPERFLDNQVKRYTYFPFGDGPRACLGQRFAQTQIKLGIAYLIKNFKVTLNSKTQLPLKYDPFYILKHPIGGLWLNFEKINGAYHRHNDNKVLETSMFLVLLVLVITLLAVLIQRRYSYWSKHGIPGPRPLPLVGNFGKSFIGKKSAGEIVTETYRKYADYPFVGLYRTITPILLIRDPDFIKHILVRDFKHFQDNDIEVDLEVDKILGRNPFLMKGASWKQKRSQLTACFTSGKIKGMYQFLEKSSQLMVQYVANEIRNSKPLEAREIFVRFTLDNVAACAFGLEGKNFEQPFSNFRELAENFMSPQSLKSKIKWAPFFLCPEVFKYLKWKLIPEEVEDRLIEIIRGSLNYRKENKVVRNDFLDVISNLPTDNGLFTEIDIVAHAASFFSDGYETSSRVMSFLVYELADNLDVQEKLREEINEAIAKNNNQFNYEIIHEMKYLDACLSESLRKNSIVYHLAKVCTEDYTYTSTNPNFKKMTVHLKAGDSIALPSRGLHMDSQYFDEPDKFIPERFLDGSNINKYVYFPFGEGQRVCLGQRFAQTQIKVGVAHLIKNFKLSVNSKTLRPLQYDPVFFMLHAIGGLWLDFKKI